MGGFLPRMHAKAHHWPCQILWNPHWKTGAGLTGGEEHEQVFSKFHLYAYVTKHMTKINRFDFLTQAILYWNWEKIENMPNSLRKNIEKARKAVIGQQEKLGGLLKSNGVTVSDLPIIHKELEIKANDIIHKRQTKNTSIDKLRENLEGLFIQMKNVSIFIFKNAGRKIH
uniref:Uncharacterized protein n=1 Tax=Daphnia galeata TaxID=27404 RepID=A0A8J2WKY6_9CRUS|nr:unnamed protein product [Daphnia galeata]